MIDSLSIFAFTVASYGVFIWIILNDRKATIRDQVGIFSMRSDAESGGTEGTKRPSNGKSRTPSRRNKVSQQTRRRR